MVFRVLADSCAKVADWRTALDLLAELRAGVVGQGGGIVMADKRSFNSTINALGRGGEWEKALKLLREMAEAGEELAVSAARKLRHLFISSIGFYFP